MCPCASPAFLSESVVDICFFFFFFCSGFSEFLPTFLGMGTSSQSPGDFPLGKPFPFRSCLVETLSRCVVFWSRSEDVTQAEPIRVSDWGNGIFSRMTQGPESGWAYMFQQWWLSFIPTPWICGTSFVPALLKTEVSLSFDAMTSASNKLVFSASKPDSVTVVYDQRTLEKPPSATSRCSPSSSPD